jgi:anthranilate phosphoribosyltransferase
MENLLGGDAAANAEIAESILRGEKGPRRDIVVLNAAFALAAADHAVTVSEGIEAASTSIDSGAALEKLERLREVSSS